MRLPRKKKKLIPKGVYCYDIISGYIFPKDGSLPYFKTKRCPYYKYIEDVDGKCTLFNCEVDDQCKICGINDGLGKY